jgi:hypothetical protein
MIIKQTRIATGGAKNVLNHVHKEDENESVRVIKGNKDDILLDAELDARALGRSKSVRHIVISPNEELTADQLDLAIQMIKDEFNIGDRPLYLVEHVKQRADGTNVSHYHALAPESYGSGSQIDHAHFMRRNEKLARKMELAFGHELTKGKHNKSVQNALISEGHVDAANAIRHLTEDGPTISKYGSKTHQKGKRLGADIPAISEALKQLQSSSPDEMAKGLVELSQKYLISIDRGDRRNAILLKNEAGDVIHNANRSLKIKAEQVSEILKLTKEILENGRLSRTTDATRTTRAGHGSDNAEQLGSDTSNQERHQSNFGLGDAERRNRGSTSTGRRAAAGSSSSLGAEDRSADANNREDAGRNLTEKRSVYHKIQRQHQASQYAALAARASEQNQKAQPHEVTIHHRLARRLVAQHVQPLLEKLRSRNRPKLGRSAFNIRQRENLAGELTDNLEVLKKHNKEMENDANIDRNTDASGSRGRAARVEQDDQSLTGPGQPARGGAADEGFVGRSSAGPRDRQRADVHFDSATKSNHSIFRAIGDRVVGRQMGRAAREVEPLRKSLSENSGMYHDVSDLQIMPDVDDPMYAEKVLSAWSKSMAGP